MIHGLIGGQRRHLKGWRPNRADPRDRLYMAPRINRTLPERIDLRLHCPPVFDQGELGSCTANATAAALEYLYGINQMSPPMLSRLFVYAMTRYLEGTPLTEDSGAQVRDAVKAVAQFGACPETTWPYDLNAWTQEPSTEAIAEAVQHRATAYYSVLTLTQIKMCLADGYPLIFGFSVPESAMSDESAKTGDIKFPQPDERIVGGHCVLAVGFDDADGGSIIFQNSWGESWGRQGFGRLRGYGWIENRLATDFTTVRAEEL